MTFAAVTEKVRLVNWLRYGGTALLAAAVAWFAVLSWHWPVVNDAALMHYVVLLRRHGFALYRGVHDINLPGAYFPDWIAMSISRRAPGLSNDLVWRVYDLGLLAAAGGAMVLIALPQDWFAGVFAGALFALLHGRDGIGQAGQRDLAIAVLWLWATAGVLVVLRRSRARTGAGVLTLLLVAVSSLALGASTTVKPFGAGYFLLLLGWVLVAQRGNKRAAGWIGLAAVGSFLLPVGVAVMLLVREHDLGSFLAMCRVMLPFHASLIDPPLGWVVRMGAPGSYVELCGPALVLLVLRRSWRSRETQSLETQVLLAATGFGLACFFVQHKNYSYQRYPYLGFLLLWAGLEYTAALRDGRWAARALGVLGLAIGIFSTAPTCLRAVSRAQWQEPYLRAMEQDLRSAGGSALDGRVQCVDSISGCLNVLYRMQLAQATGTMYDEFLFPPMRTNARAVEAIGEAQEAFMRELGERPPKVFVVSSWLFADGPGDYGKLGRWPAFRAYLEANYRVVDEQSFPRAENGPLGFRMYVRWR